MLILPQNKQNCKYPIHIQFAHRYLISSPSLCLIFPNTFHILPALDSSPYQNVSAYFKSRGIAGISSPANTRDIVTFSIRSVHCKEADRQSLFQAVFSGNTGGLQIYPSRKIWFTGIPASSSSRNFNSVQMRKAPAGCAFLHVCYRNGTVREFPHTVPRNPG